MMIVVAAVAPQAVAQSAPDRVAANDKDAQSKTASDKVVCHRERVTGSFMRWRKICVKASDWQKIQAARNKAAGESLDQSRTGWASGASGL